MDERLILILITLLLFFGCRNRIDIPNPTTNIPPQYFNPDDPPPQLKFTTNDTEYWAIRFPEPANRVLKIVKNFEIYSNIVASNEVIISNQEIQIANGKKIIKKTTRQKRRSAWKWVGIVSGASILSVLLGMIIQFFKGFLV